MDSVLEMLARYLPPSATQFVIRWLSTNLEEFEIALDYASGGSDYKCPDWLILTNRRVIYISKSTVKSMNFGECFIAYPTSSLKDARFDKKLLREAGSLTITSSMGLMRIETVGTNEANRFVASVLKAISKL